MASVTNQTAPKAKTVITAPVVEPAAIVANKVTTPTVATVAKTTASPAVVISPTVGIANNTTNTVSPLVAPKPKTVTTAPVYGTSVKDPSGVYS